MLLVSKHVVFSHTIQTCWLLDVWWYIEWLMNVYRTLSHHYYRFLECSLQWFQSWPQSVTHGESHTTNLRCTARTQMVLVYFSYQMYFKTSLPFTSTDPGPTLLRHQSASSSSCSHSSVEIFPILLIWSLQAFEKTISLLASSKQTYEI